jgi:hypothetical protein
VPRAHARGMSWARSHPLEDSLLIEPVDADELHHADAARRRSSPDSWCGLSGGDRVDES